MAYIDIPWPVEEFASNEQLRSVIFAGTLVCADTHAKGFLLCRAILKGFVCPSEAAPLASACFQSDLLRHAVLIYSSISEFHLLQDNADQGAC